MNRARVIVKEVSITLAGEVNFFQVRLPHNVRRIIGLQTDAVILSGFTLLDTSPVVLNPSGTVGDSVNRTPFLKWDSNINPTLGKLKLQSPDKAGIFFESWPCFLFLSGGMPDMSFGGFPKSPYSIDGYVRPKNVSLDPLHRFVEGMFEDDFGKRQNKDIAYTLKIFLWVETTEQTKGVVFDFQEKETPKNASEGMILQIKV